MDEYSHPQQADLLDEVGVAFSQLRRRTRRRGGSDHRDLARNLVVNLVDEFGGQLSVGGLADELGADPSAGSRMVSDCIGAGLVRRVAHQRDGRRIVLELTSAGREQRDRFRQQQREAYEQITANWEPAERVELARLLLKYVDAARTLDQEQG